MATVIPVARTIARRELRGHAHRLELSTRNAGDFDGLGDFVRVVGIRRV